VRWVGIDEAGYGPNLGPMVMTAVIAESTRRENGDAASIRTLDFWGDLAGTVDRAGGDPERLWVDDSKAILRGGKGRDRLEIACLAAVHAACQVLPGCLGDLLDRLGAGNLIDIELSRWAEDGKPAPAWPVLSARAVVEERLAGRPLVPAGAKWRITAVASVVVGPERFNGGLAVHGSKAAVHYAAFERLLKLIWDRASDGAVTFVKGDKHGGRHFYLQPLYESFPDAWIDRGPEGSDLSQYTIRDGNRKLDVCLVPRADQTDGLVALASIVSKTVRELWMDVFNAYWCAHVPGLRPTAGYPTDAFRFRRAIEEVAAALGHDPELWWRIK
jgi:hypothetical protein